MIYIDLYQWSIQPENRMAASGLSGWICLSGSLRNPVVFGIVGFCVLSPPLSSTCYLTVRHGKSTHISERIFHGECRLGPSTNHGEVWKITRWYYPYPWRIHGAGIYIYSNIKGVYWWYINVTIYSSIHGSVMGYKSPWMWKSPWRWTKRPRKMIKWWVVTFSIFYGDFFLPMDDLFLSIFIYVSIWCLYYFNESNFLTSWFSN